MVSAAASVLQSVIVPNAAALCYYCHITYFLPFKGCLLLFASYPTLDFAIDFLLPLVECRLNGNRLACDVANLSRLTPRFRTI